jgi:DNA-binding CsgD family transcriptional regulator
MGRVGMADARDNFIADVKVALSRLETPTNSRDMAIQAISDRYQFNEREREAIRLLFAAKKYREIGAALGLDAKYANTFMGRIFKKADCRSVVEFILHAYDLS